jgi:hypothetical protein
MMISRGAPLMGGVSPCFLESQHIKNSTYYFRAPGRTLVIGGSQFLL